MGPKEPEPRTPPAYVVGIGASAGGLEAIEAFFSSMPKETDLSFVVVQHLSPDYKSLMVEILSKKTAMPVRRAEEGMEVRPGEIYLIPPKKNLTIFHGRLLLSDQEPSRGINLPIDVFLQSLAEDQEDKSVAVILSGTGSDGMRGVRAIKQAGGMIMVQEPEGAKFDGMPRAALSTGLADFVLAPEEMPPQLIAFATHPHLAGSDRAGARAIPEEDGMTRIFALLRERCKVDFTNYKPSTVLRRVDRRMMINRVETTADYFSHMRATPSEVTTLFRELLIGVTGFFRDPWVFDYLAREIVPALVEGSDGRELRCWVAGCSTGEEAYTYAMLVSHVLEEQGLSREIKIFATDVDREATQFAALGAYPESIAADIPPAFLAKYFYRKDEHFHISRNIREMVVFAQHNLIRDPPFTGMDLISCRNLLIYLQPVLQTKVLEFFRFSLRPQGVLVLGTSETAGELGEAFAVADAKAKVYRSKGRGSGLIGATSLTAGDTRMRELYQHAGQLRGLSSRQSGRNEEERILERFLDALAPDILPVAVIVNEQLEVLHIVGDSQPYFRFPPGKPTAELDKITVRELSVPLVTATQKALREDRQLRFSGIRLNRGEKDVIVDITVLVLPAKAGQAPLAAALIAPQLRKPEEETGREMPTYDLSREAEQRINDLEQELQFSRENLQATIEELETANEELQATNEELPASNEELQSTNEELQSTNEELFTVNAEYNTKILELTELNNDVGNLINSRSVGVLLIDENLEVRRFSPACAKILDLTDADIQRPLSRVPSRLVGLDLAGLIAGVAPTGAGDQLQAESEDGSWYMIDVQPYRISPEETSGFVVTSIDITDRKRAELELDKQLRAVGFLSSLSADLLRIPLEELPIGMGDSLSKVARFFSAERTAIYSLTCEGLAAAPEVSSDGSSDPSGDLPPAARVPWISQLREGEIVEQSSEEGSRRAVIVPLESAGEVSAVLHLECAPPTLTDETRQLLKTVADILCSCLERARAHRLQVEEAGRYRLLVETTDAVPWEYWIATDTWTYVAPQAESILGYAPSAWEGVQFWYERLHPEDRGWAADYCDRCTAKGEDHVFEYRFRRPDGSYIWVRDVVRVEMQDGHPVRLRGFMINITERREAEDKIAGLLSEKEMLLRELSHRVKNNLTTLSSLLALQEDTSVAPDAKAALAEARRRVETLQNVYNLLSDGAMDGSVDLREYFESLIPAVCSSGLFESQITLTRRIAAISLSADTVIALGMITNELITNSAKYAFAPGGSGTVSVVVESSGDGTATLTVADDGEGFAPEALDNPGLGLPLVQGLAGQIGGDLGIQTGEEGSAVRVSFTTNGAEKNAR